MSPRVASVHAPRNTPITASAIIEQMESRRHVLRRALRTLQVSSPAHQLNALDSDLRADLRTHGAVNPLSPKATVDGPGPLVTLGMWLPIASGLASQWWNHHQARLGIQLADSTLTTIARKHPLALVAAGAAAGSAIMLIKPWRRMSLAGLFVSMVSAKSAGPMSAVLNAVKALTQTR
jgi:hypothetical protein